MLVKEPVGAISRVPRRHKRVSRVGIRAGQAERSHAHLQNSAARIVGVVIQNSGDNQIRVCVTGDIGDIECGRAVGSGADGGRVIGSGTVQNVGDGGAGDGNRSFQAKCAKGTVRAAIRQQRSAVQIEAGDGIEKSAACQGAAGVEHDERSDIGVCAERVACRECHHAAANDGCIISVNGSGHRAGQPVNAGIGVVCAVPRERLSVRVSNTEQPEEQHSAGKICVAETLVFLNIRALPGSS